MVEPRRSTRLGKSLPLSGQGDKKANTKRSVKTRTVQTVRQDTTRPDVDIKSDVSTASYEEDFPPDPDPETLEAEAVMEGGVRHANYRDDCLIENGIYIRNPSHPLPGHVAKHVEQIGEIIPRTPELHHDQVASALQQLDGLGLFCSESQVFRLFGRFVFPEPVNGNCPPAQGLKAVSELAIARHLLPVDPNASLPVSQPRPDLLYGYPDSVFTYTQMVVLRWIHPQIRRYTRPCSGIELPFLAAEFMASVGMLGNLWSATNECAGTSAASLQALDALNVALDEAGCGAPVDNFFYSFAIDNDLAQLFVAWKDSTSEGVQVCMQRIESFLLSDPEHFVRLRRRVLGILEWGKGERLAAIHRALDSLQQAREKARGKRTRQQAAGGKGR